ncbi:hypothetical protein Tco_0630851 [Tanacetum coccineum]
MLLIFWIPHYLNLDFICSPKEFRHQEHYCFAVLGTRGLDCSPEGVASSSRSPFVVVLIQKKFFFFRVSSQALIPLNNYCCKFAVTSKLWIPNPNAGLWLQFHVVCACARFQVTPKVSHLHAVKRIFRYLKGQPKLGLWYPKDSPFDLEAYIDSDYAGASLDRKAFDVGRFQYLIHVLECLTSEVLIEGRKIVLIFSGVCTNDA